jgi:hypothetical protein
MPQRLYSKISPNGQNGWYWEVHVETAETHRVIARGLAATAAEARREAAAAEACATRKGDQDIKRAG